MRGTKEAKWKIKKKVCKAEQHKIKLDFVIAIYGCMSAAIFSLKLILTLHTAVILLLTLVVTKCEFAVNRKR